jgi:hypothetical protein
VFQRAIKRRKESGER